MATRGEQKIDEKKLQKAVESWVKQHRAKIADQRMQAAVDDFVKQHRKEVSERGMKIIRRVIAEGRTTPTVKSKTPTRGSSLRTEDRRPKVTKQGVEKMVKTATDKGKSTLKDVSKIGKVAKGLGVVTALVTPGDMGVPKGEATSMAEEYAKAERDANLARLKKQMAENKKADSKPKAETKPKPTPKADSKPKPKNADDKPSVTPKEAAAVKKKMADAQVAKRREALRAHNKRITAMSPEERKKYRESEAGKSGKLLKNRGGSVSKYSSGGMAQRANCGASMKPTQKSSRGIR